MNGIDDGDVILELKDITKAYSGIVALKKADLKLRRGAVNVLVGENGAGKSTMMRIIAGVERPTLGEIWMDGECIHLDSPADAVRHGIGIVFQELNLFGNLSVAENIFATREITRGLRGIDHKAQVEKANAFLDRLEAGISADTLAEDLPIGQQQLVEIARAVSLDTRILIMDEPTSALSAAEVDVLFRVIADLKARGVAIVYISHRLEELMRIGDYITVLKDGQITGHAVVRDIDTQWIVRSMIGSDAKDFAKPLDHEPGEEVFRTQDISLPRAQGGYAVDHVSFGVRKGEILGIYGLMGAGRSELFECIMGRHEHATGRIFIEGEELKGRDTTRRIREGLALIPEDRQREGLVQSMSIADNLSMASLGRFLKGGFHIDLKLEKKAVLEAIRNLSIKAKNPDFDVTSMSGGNQQKVVIARSLNADPTIVILDEPTKGIDVGSKNEIYGHINQMAKEGKAIIMISSELPELMAMSDRFVVMAEGRVAGELDGQCANEAAIMALAVKTFKTIA